jgi:hypothetical protein
MPYTEAIVYFIIMYIDCTDVYRKVKSSEFHHFKTLAIHILDIKFVRSIDNNVYILCYFSSCDAAFNLSLRLNEL